MTQRVVRLVRHGRASAGWDRDPDPDLDELGRRQADSVAVELAALVPRRIVTSPLQRCRSTAAALAARLDLDVDIDLEVVDAVAEIPSPIGVEMVDRVEWLRSAMHGTWTELGPRYVAYRDNVVEFVRSCDDATIVFSHFIAINTAIGACLGDDRLVIRRLDNCSVTTVAVDGDRLQLLEGGREADTLIR